MTEQPERGRPRPAFLKALGEAEPPEQVVVNGTMYDRVETFKHDAWAATALYSSGTDDVVCKFHRRQAVIGIPMHWLGRWLARHERTLLSRLADLDTVPRDRGPVRVKDTLLSNAVARDFVPGQALQQRDVGIPVFERPASAHGDASTWPDRFLAELKELIRSVHQRDAAYVDLHKYENMIVGDDGRPWLIDFQISFALPARGILRRGPARWLLQILQSCDRYHLQKLVIRYRSMTVREADEQLLEHRPVWIRVHRMFATPVRLLRRTLLVALKVRRGAGFAETEFQPEIARRSASRP